MAPIKDLRNRRFGRLVVVGLLPERRNGQLLWLCYCDCGNSHVSTSPHLRHGDVKSCGCLAREMAIAKQPLASAKSKQVLLKHGETVKGTKSAEYSIWANMWTRCTNPKSGAAQYYLDRGISVCNRWRDFSAFLADMGRRPAGTSLDRIDTNGNYEPGNCRWATISQQANNKRKESWSKNTSEAIKKHWKLRRLKGRTS